MKYSKITISGKICTGKTTLFRNLQKQLNWPIFSTSQYFRDLALNNKLSLEKAEEQNQKITKAVDNRVRLLLKAEGNLIAEGWMTGLMADNYPGILKILLQSEDEIRIKRFALREEISTAEAKKRIKDRETNLFSRLSKIYERNDFVDAKNYNLIVDTSILNPAQVLEKVFNYLQ